MLKRIAVFGMVLVGSAAVSAGSLVAQQAQPASKQTLSDQDIDALRAQLRSDKKQLVAVNLPLTDTEAEKFWPVYDQYTAEVVKVNDTKWALIQQYANAYSTMTDAQAHDLITQWIGTDASASQLRLKYIPVFEKVLPSKKVAMFMQIDRRVGLLTDLALASNIPLVQP